MDPLRYSLLIADTVEVASSNARVLTSYKLALDDVSYKIEDDAEEDNDAEAADAAGSGTGASGRSRKRTENPAESGLAKRREHQQRLFEERQRDNVRRYHGAGPVQAEDPADQVRKVEAYRSSASIPREAKPNKVRPSHALHNQRPAAAVIAWGQGAEVADATGCRSACPPHARLCGGCGRSMWMSSATRCSCPSTGCTYRSTLRLSRPCRKPRARKGARRRSCALASMCRRQ